MNTETGSQPYALLSNTPTEIELQTSSSSGWYRLYFVNIGCYLDSGKSDYYTHPNSSTGHSYHMFSFQETEGGYKLVNYNYQSYFIGKKSSNYHITNLTSGDIVWRLWSANNVTDLSRYFLYQALEISDNYDFDVSKYEEIYESNTCIIGEIREATQELNKRNALAKIIAEAEPYYEDPTVLNKYKNLLNDSEKGIDDIEEIWDELEMRNNLAKAISEAQPYYENPTILDKYKDFLNDNEKWSDDSWWSLYDELWEELEMRNNLAKAISEAQPNYEDPTILNKYKDILNDSEKGSDNLNDAISELSGRNAIAEIIANDSVYGDLLNKWKTILYDTEVSATQLNEAVLELRRAMEFTETLVKPSWNEGTFLITRTSPNLKIRKDDQTRIAVQYNSGSYYNNWNYVTSYDNNPRIYYTEGTWDMPITLKVDEEAVFVFNYYCNGNENSRPHLTILLDEKEIRQVTYIEGNESKRQTIPLTSGTHTVTLRLQCNSGSDAYFNIYNIGVLSGEEICIDMLEPGELASELFKQVSNLQQVRRLKVRGPMNDDDWDPIYAMNKLISLDLSETNLTKIKAQQLSLDKYNSLSFLSTLRLPNTLKEIGEEAFQDTPIDSITFPSSLTTIGNYAFSNTNIRQAILPQSATSIGNCAFSECRNLRVAKLPQDITIVPQYLFYQCSALDSLIIGTQLTRINNYAFFECSSLKTFDFPTTLEYIGTSAFAGCTSLKFSTLPTINNIGTKAFNGCTALDTLTISDGITMGNNVFDVCRGLKVVNIGKNCSLGQWAFYYCEALDSVVIGEGTTLGNQVFYYCRNLRSVEFPTTYYTCTSQQLVGLTGNKLKTVVLKSPSLIKGTSYKSFFNNVNTDSLTVYVPSFQLSNYMLDSYWYQFNLQAFDEEISDWTINAPMTLGSTNRIDGTPNLTINETGTLRVNGTAAQNINDLSTRRNGNNSAMILSKCDNVHIEGTYAHDHYTARNIWNFLTMPFDFRAGDVTSLDEAQMVLRRYDGAHRATSGTGNNWVNCGVDDVVAAGEGFILMTSRDGWVRFTALNTSSKQNAVSNQTLTKSLEANPSATTANKGWNLVGNMWMTYYDGHKLPFVAPITTWTGSTYKAYSLTDDDIAIAPTQAFFVQCPNEVSEITFPTDGRQLTNVIENPNAAPSLYPSNNQRWLVNLALMTDTIQDETRIVINNRASLDYESACDASKFMSMDTSTPQLWSIGTDGETQYAINERPLDDAVVAIGLRIPSEGTYTLQATRNKAGHILLVDKLMCSETDLSEGDYEFLSAAGTLTERFELRFTDDTLTGIEQTNMDKEKTVTYSLDGRRVETTGRGIYIIKRGQHTQKVILK